ncbi:MAG TPA: hypothetical protein VHE30_25875 [Polyangiaceae bacterium]|nr:hypothetical protein [Polyangiaceae bacterium]
MRSYPHRAVPGAALRVRSPCSRGRERLDHALGGDRGPEGEFARRVMGVGYMVTQS